MQKKLNIKIDEDTKVIFDILKMNSNAYIIGGYVRDNLLGIEPKDCDFCTNLSLEKILEIFSDKNQFEIKIISERLNIIQLKYNNKKFEIARLRKDLRYYGNRKDFDFNFVNEIEEDLPRRDFTINSIAYDGENIIFIDEKVLEDLKNKRICFIGSSEQRILEDPFRILRLFRLFSEKSLLEIDIDTLNNIKKHKKLIWTLSKEMIQKELISIIKGKNYLNTFVYINKINLFEEKFFIADYEDKYKSRIRSLFRNSDFSLLRKLNFPNNIIKMT